MFFITTIQRSATYITSICIFNINIYKNKNVKQQVITEEIEEDAPIIPLEEMLEEMNLDEIVQDDDDDDMVLAGSSEEEN